MFRVYVCDEFIKDRSVVKVIGRRGKVAADKRKKFKVQFLSFLNELD
jgi:hypothetical protein